MAEREPARSRALLLSGGVFLAIGAAYLASVVTAVPFAAMATLVLARRNGATWREAIQRGSLFLIVTGGIFLVILTTSYVWFSGNPISVAGISESVLAKADLRPPKLSLALHLARLAFGTVNNLVALPGLGATVQAWMRGQIDSLWPYISLLPLTVLWLLTSATVALIYTGTLVALWRRRCCVAPLAFLAGAQTWTLWYGLNDPEHWFQLTAPSIILLLTVLPVRLARPVLPAWAAVGTGVNLALLALPVATYPLHAHETELAAMLEPRDLLVYFATSPGRPYVGFLTVPCHRFALDLALQQPGASVQSMLADLDDQVDGTMRAGGRVIVADILEPTDWEAPWMEFLSRGLAKPMLYGYLHARGHETRLQDVGGIELWQLSPPH